MLVQGSNIKGIPTHLPNRWSALHINWQHGSGAKARAANAQHSWNSNKCRQFYNIRHKQFFRASTATDSQLFTIKPTSYPLPSCCALHRINCPQDLSSYFPFLSDVLLQNEFLRHGPWCTIYTETMPNARTPPHDPHRLKALPSILVSLGASGEIHLKSHTRIPKAPCFRSHIDR